MAKVCEFCGKNPKTRKNPFRKKKIPRRRFFRRFHSVYFPAKYGDKIIKVCRNCFEMGKVIHIFQPARTPAKAKSPL